MATSWIVLTADRGTLEAERIIASTEWDEYVVAADEVLYTDPVDLGGNRVDAGWKVGGSVSLAAGVYTYTDPSVDTTLVARQRSQIHRAYLYWRIFGRTGHWGGIRIQILVGGDGANADEIDPNQRNAALEATDYWAYHIVALMDQMINGAVFAGRTAEQKQELLDHADVIFRTLGPTWYQAQIDGADGDRITANAINYRGGPGMALVAGSLIYTDICTAAGVPRGIDGAWNGMPTTIRNGFNPELPSLGN